MDSQELKKRTKQFALDIIKFVDTLPKNKTGDVIGRQLLRSATSVTANYRAACRARSRADFISKISIVEEEADDSQFWLEQLLESGISADKRAREFLQEATELTAIFTSSVRTAKTNR